MRKMIAKELKISEDAITDIVQLKKGMTNTSYRFTVAGKQYIFRVPGVGTENLISRQNEYASYEAIKHLSIADDVIYFEPLSGVKVTKFLDNIHSCDPNNLEEVKKCMAYLHAFHDKNIKVGHSFNLRERILYYETLRHGPSMYEDYYETRTKIFRLLDYIDSLCIEHSLTHIDAVPDNFVLNDDGIKLIDWEYSGMNDPHVDVAMFAVYSNYTTKQLNDLIEMYFAGKMTYELVYKIYAYTAIVGFLWSNWCEYKLKRGQDFGAYNTQQYNFAKQYSEYVLTTYLSKITYRIENAIILAAGQGKRLMPLTKTTPKPLIKVNGKPIIETSIEALHSRGIKDISIVVGHLKEQFEYLIDKYGVELIDNPDYLTTNNISSLFYARHKLRNTIIMDGDLIVVNPDEILTSIRKSGYSCYYTAHWVNEWMLTLYDTDKSILKIDKNGGKNAYALISLSYWNQLDTSRLKQLLEYVYLFKDESTNFWDCIPCQDFHKEFNLRAYIIDRHSLIEIDDIQDLIAADKSYLEANNEKIR